MSNSYKEPVYLISMVAEILNIHPQTLRQYEREGLIYPSRTNGKIRLYSQEDIDNIKVVLNLTRNLGVNLAGVSMILKQNKKINKLENEILKYKKELERLKHDTLVPHDKALIIKQQQYDVVVVEEIIV
jgi:MerR family transcriptional regulator/heat shock protein HspR